MVSFLFWNLNRSPLEGILANLALRNQIDVLVLVESSIAPAALLKSLNRDNGAAYHYARSWGCRQVEVFTRFPSKFIRPVYEEDRLTIRHLKLPGLRDILLAATHFPSKTHWSEPSQTSESVELANSIRMTESQVGHARTLLVGDLNMNPFEDGVVSANGLHGVMSRGIAERRTRIVRGREYPFFYNPMWGLFGDSTPGPPGTYYYTRSEQRVFFWNMFDQVLLRPDLLPLFNDEDVRILTSDGDSSLLSQSGLPDERVASDHLPVLFSLGL